MCVCVEMFSLVFRRSSLASDIHTLHTHITQSGALGGAPPCASASNNSSRGDASPLATTAAKSDLPSS